MLSQPESDCCPSWWSEVWCGTHLTASLVTGGCRGLLFRIFHLLRSILPPAFWKGCESPGFHAAPVLRVFRAFGSGTRAPSYDSGSELRQRVGLNRWRHVQDKAEKCSAEFLENYTKVGAPLRCHQLSSRSQARKDQTLKFKARTFVECL